MEYFCDVNVGYISVCVEKTEQTDFDFVNTSRFGDGFVCFTSGSGKLIFNGQSPLEIAKGTFVRFNRGDSYEFHVNGPCSYITSEMELKYGENFPRLTQCTDNEIDYLRRICDRFKEKDRLCLIETKIMILRFLAGLDQKNYGNSSQTDYVLNFALDYLHRNYNKNFTIEEMASECHLSPSYLMQSFKNSQGVSIMEYRERLRIRNAKDMLKSNAFRIKEIASALGYCDVYHFSKRFKSATGKTPANYIKSHFEIE